MSPVLSTPCRTHRSGCGQSPSRSKQGKRPRFRAWRALNAPDLRCAVRPSVPRLLPQIGDERDASASAMFGNGQRKSLGRGGDHHELGIFAPSGYLNYLPLGYGLPRRPLFFHGRPPGGLHSELRPRPLSRRGPQGFAEGWIAKESEPRTIGTSFVSRLPSTRPFGLRGLDPDQACAGLQPCARSSSSSIWSRWRL